MDSTPTKQVKPSNSSDPINSEPTIHVNQKFKSKLYLDSNYYSAIENINMIKKRLYWFKIFSIKNRVVFGNS